MIPQIEKQLLFVYLGPPSSGGTVQALARLAPILVRDYPIIEFVTYDDSGTIAKLGYPVVGIGLAPTSGVSGVPLRRSLRQIPNVVRYLLRIRRAIRKRPHALVLPFLTGSALVTLAATIGLPNRVIACERNDVSLRSLPWHIWLLQNLLYPRATAVTVNSFNPMASDLLRQISRGRPIYVVPNPHPRGMQCADAVNSRVILSVGRLVREKQHSLLIEAFARISRQCPEWRVVIVGDGPLRSALEEQICRLGLRDRVSLVGQVDNPSRYFADAGIFVLPSDYEGTSNALLEAASASLPCIVSATAAPTATNETFRIFAPREVSLLAHHLLELCNSGEERRIAGVAARDWLRGQEGDLLESWGAALAGEGP